MKRECLIVFISILSCVCVFCYPSKPLNERSTELAWEAWLLVDQSNKGDMGMLRRRITPKSVFIAPTFSTESLPACADGYKSDMMGRCVRIIKINESVHFDFLRQKLSAQFLDYEEEVVDVETSTSGPLQFNIPLFAESEEKLLENETAVAIVVTPSSKSHRDKTVQVDIKRTTGDKFGVEDVAAILGVKPEDVEMTTIADLGETSTTTTDEVTSTTTEVGTTEISTTEVGTTEPTTTGDALFFQLRV